MPPNSNPAASSWVTVDGLRASLVAGTATYSACAPSFVPVMPHTSSPDAKPRPALAISTIPAKELVSSVERLQGEWRERLAGPTVASELAVPLKSANAALRTLVDAGVLVEHGTVQPSGRGRPSRLYTSPELLGLTGSDPLQA